MKPCLFLSALTGLLLTWQPALAEGGYRTLEDPTARNRAAMLALELGTDFWNAVSENDLRVVRRFLDAAPALVDTPDVEGRTPLGLAPSPMLAALLLARGARLDPPGHSTYPPLTAQAAADRVDVVRFLVSRGALIKSALLAACRAGSPTAVDLLLRQGPGLSLRELRECLIVTLNSTGPFPPDTLLRTASLLQEEIRRVQAATEHR